MSDRRTILALSLLVLALGGANFALRHSTTVQMRSMQRTALIDPAGKYTRITIERSGLPPTELRKDPVWQLRSPIVASVEESRVLKLLDILATTPVADAISDAELLRLGRTRADFQLKDPPLRVTVGDDRHGERIDFGSPSPAADGVYVAVEGVSAVAVVPTSVVAAVSCPVEAFRRRSLIDLNYETLAGLDIKQTGGMRLDFSRSAAGWRLGSETAALTKVRELVSELTTARIRRFVWPVGASNEDAKASTSLLSIYGLDPDSATTVTLKGTDGIDRQLSFGKAAADGENYALVQNGGAIVTVDAKLKELATQDRLLFTDSRLFPLAPDQIDAFTLGSGDDILSLRRDSTRGWQLITPILAPADNATVEEVLGRITSISSMDLRSEGLAVSVSTNVRPIVVAREKALGSLRLEELRSLEIMRLAPETVRRIVLTRNGVAIPAVVRDRERKLWQLESESAQVSVNVEGVEALLGAVNPLRAVRIEKLKVKAEELANYGLESPALTIAFDLNGEGALRRNLLVGEVAEGGYYATVGSSEAIFVISPETFSLLGFPLTAK